MSHFSSNISFPGSTPAPVGSGTPAKAPAEAQAGPETGAAPGLPSRELRAYVVGPTEGWIIEPASPRRQWMDEFSNGFPYRCLPLAMANQLGWVIRCPVGFSATWTGGFGPAEMTFQFDEKPEHFRHMIQSHFGKGVLTFSLPWLFRTAPGVSLLVRGMPNFILPSAGAIPLEGLVETFWAPMTFTMNWQVVARHTAVRFEKGDPVCMITPLELSTVEETQPSFHSLEEDKMLDYEFRQWSAYRRGFIDRQGRKPEEWQKDYMHGRHLDGRLEGEHRSKLELKPFAPRS